MNVPCELPEEHDPHSWGDVAGLYWCDGDVADPDTDLMADLMAAEAENTQSRPCQVCGVLAGMSEPVARALRSGLAGTIGRDKLVAVLNKHGYTVGRRAIERHRQEGHS